MWDVIHQLVEVSSLSDAGKAEAYQLIDTHLAQHLGIAREQGEHRERIRKLESGNTASEQKLW
jgi:hypothetical protein